jgi:hypothetical protein
MSDISNLRMRVIESIRASFAGVTLGDGISMRQAEVIDGYGEGYTDEEFERLKLSEIVDDWVSVPFAELERDNIAHLDAEGFRYYIPAFMMSLLEHYEPASMRVIGTLSALSRPFHDDLLGFEQKRSVALFLSALPELVNLDNEDETMVREALRKYWTHYLPLYVPPSEQA